MSSFTNYNAGHYEKDLYWWILLEMDYEDAPDSIRVRIDGKDQVIFKENDDDKTGPVLALIPKAQINKFLEGAK